MSEPKLILLVQLKENDRMIVTLGTRHESLLALALRKAALSIDNVLLENDSMSEEKPVIEIPKTILDKI